MPHMNTPRVKREDSNGMTPETPGRTEVPEIIEESPSAPTEKPEAKTLPTPPDDGTARVERLLEYAASFKPEAEAPADLATRALMKKGLLRRPGRRSLAARPWWSLGTVGITVAAATLLYCRGALPLGATPGALPSPFVAEIELTPVRVEYVRSDSGSSLFHNVSHVSSRAAVHPVSDQMEPVIVTGNPAEVMTSEVVETTQKQVERQSSRVTNVVYTRPRARRYRAYRSETPVITASRKEAAEKPPVVRWEVEPPTRPSYRMYVPVVLMDEEPTSEGSASGEVMGTPGVLEVAFDPTAEMMPRP
jgi:hypothetical protein